MTLTCKRLPPPTLQSLYPPIAGYRYLDAARERLPGNLRHGLGALTPIESIGHAPLHYAIKCFNSALAARSDAP